MPQDSLAELPKVSNRYQLLDVVKVDRIWTTYRAQDHVLKREVLLKTVKDLDCLSEAELHRIESQARSAARLSHPKVEAVLDFGSFSGTPYLVSDCLSGQTLRDYIESKEIPNLESAIDVFIQMAEIVEYMHDHKVIHNNLSLDSFLVILDGGQLEIRLTGLDFVGDIDSSHNQDQANTKSRRDKYGDLRALGLIFHKVLLRREGPSTSQLSGAFRKVDEGHLISRQLGYGLMDSIVDRCLSDDNRERYQSAFSLKKELIEGKQRLMTWDETPLYIEPVPKGDENLLRKVRIGDFLDDGTFLMVNCSLLLAIVGIVLYYLFARVL